MSGLVLDFQLHDCRRITGGGERERQLPEDKRLVGDEVVGPAIPSGELGGARNHALLQAFLNGIVLDPHGVKCFGGGSFFCESLHASQFLALAVLGVKRNPNTPSHHLDKEKAAEAEAPTAGYSL